jgi:hypothetical protein
MSDMNMSGRAHSQDPAEGVAEEETIDEAAPDEDMALNTIEPPPPVDASMQGVPDASDALEDTGPDEPGANATGVGV